MLLINTRHFSGASNPGVMNWTVAGSTTAADQIEKLACATLQRKNYLEAHIDFINTWFLDAPVLTF